MSRILGVDYGERRIGMAISDEAEILALPLTTATITTPREAVAAVSSVCSDRGVSRIVVGLPLNMNGTRGQSAEKVTAFADELKRQVSLPVELWDERLSSRQVERMLVEADVSRSKRKSIVDKLAAQVILQGFLDSRSHVDLTCPSNDTK